MKVSFRNIFQRGPSSKGFLGSRFSFLRSFTGFLEKNISGPSFLQLAARINPRFVKVSAWAMMAVVLLSIGAKAMINLTGVLRLTPLSVTVTPESDLPPAVQALETETVGQAFDRDTTSLYTSYGKSAVKLSFEGVEEIQELRVYGSSPYIASFYTVDVSGNLSPISGWTNVNLSSLGAGWNKLDLNNPVNAKSLAVSLVPTTTISQADSNSPVGISEMEFWGQGIAQNETDGQAWDTLFHAPSAPSTLLVSGREYLAGAPVTGSSAVTLGGPNSPATVTFTVNLPMGGQSFRKAWLMYDVDGLVQLDRRSPDHQRSGSGGRMAPFRARTNGPPKWNKSILFG